MAHEDDPERAVRAGLRILEAIDELSRTRSSTSPCAQPSLPEEGSRNSAPRPETGARGFETGERRQQRPHDNSQDRRRSGAASSTSNATG